MLHHFEKLLSMLMSDWTLKDRSPLIVVDEAHMFNLKERGVKLDTLLASLSRPAHGLSCLPWKAEKL